MNIAYLISAHTDASQLARLIGALHADADFFVHIDQKSDIRQFTAAIQSANVHFLESRVDVRWGTMLEVDYQMLLIKAAIDSPCKYDRIFFLSGMDYPLWSNARIERWLEEHQGEEILQGLCLASPEVEARHTLIYRIARPFVNLPWLSGKWNQRIGIVLRNLLKWVGYRKELTFMMDGDEWSLWKGSAWWCISEELARYVYDMYMHHPDITDYFKNSFGQAETLIQTIAFNSSEWASRCMAATGNYRSLQELTPLHHIDYVPVIRVWKSGDLPVLLQSGKMFARKFQSGVSDDLITEIEEERRKE